MKRPTTYEELMSIPQDIPWNQQMAASFRRLEQMDMFSNLDEVPPEAYQIIDMRVTPYLAQLMDRNDPSCPIRQQYLPSKEQVTLNSEIADSLGEDEDMHEGTSVVHRYPKRVLFLVFNTCGSLCRYCTRSRLVSHAERSIPKDEIEEGLEYIASNREIDDVLISGGDPLLLQDSRLDYILGEIRRRAPHVRFLRIGSRFPVQAPSRITDELIEVLVRHDVDLINVHVNHPKEVTPYFKSQMRKLAKSGIMIGNQSVLLKGVNDDARVLTELNMRLLDCRIKPYYVYTCDNVRGAHRYFVPYTRTIEIIEQMRGWNSGPSMPTFVLDGVGGLGKLPIQPEYVKLGPAGEVLLRNYEGQTARAYHLEGN